MRGCFKFMLGVAFFLVFLLAYSSIAPAELIEPTRTLEGEPV